MVYAMLAAPMKTAKKLTGKSNMLSCYRSLIDTVKMVQSGCVRRVYAYEVPLSAEWVFRKFEPKFQPNLFHDIGETLAKKPSYANLRK